MQEAQSNSGIMAVNVISHLLLVAIKWFNKKNLLSNILRNSDENFS